MPAAAPYPTASPRRKSVQKQKQAITLTTAAEEDEQQQQMVYYSPSHHVSRMDPNDNRDLSPDPADQESRTQQHDPTDLLAAAAAAAAGYPDLQGHDDATNAAMQQVSLLPGQVPMTFPPVPPGAVPVAYFAGPSGTIIAVPQAKAKRRQVKNACTNCQKACKKCDEVRPCHRCVKYGIDKDCIDSQRKERKKGVKRGPYKKREQKTGSDNEISWVPLGSLLAAQAAQAAEGPEEENNEDPSGSNQTAEVNVNAGAAESALHALTSGAILYSFATASTPTGQAHSVQHMPQLQALQTIKGPDGSTLALPAQYFFTAPAVQPAEESPEAGESGHSSDPQPESEQEDEGQPSGHQAPQQAGYPIQYYGQVGQMAYGQTIAPGAGFVLQAPSHQGNPAMYLSSMNSGVGSNEDPIERQLQPTAPIPVVDSPQTQATTRRKKAKASTSRGSRKNSE